MITFETLLPVLSLPKKSLLIFFFSFPPSRECLSRLKIEFKLKEAIGVAKKSVNIEIVQLFLFHLSALQTFKDTSGWNKNEVKHQDL